MVDEILQLQRFIFETPLTRKKLLDYSVKQKKTYDVQVFRNHSFELVEHTIGAFLDYAEIGISFQYSGYDDSFSFLELNPNANLIVIWIDTTRYHKGKTKDFLIERAKSLRAMVNCPILVVPFGDNIEINLSGVTIFNLSGIEQELGDRYTDRRVEKLSGTPLSSEALLRISRTLGLKYFPTLLRPPIKAIVVDLDNTLYEGVLGEDGVEGVKLNIAHKKIQTLLKQLSKEGFFVCAVSKNEQESVLELFHDRKDFPLQVDDFSKICASWMPKAESIEKIAKFLNIDSSAILFVDDNIGELTAVKMAFPMIRLILADPEGMKTFHALEEYPGLFKFSTSREDELRKIDTKANQIREEMRKSMDIREYIQSLNISLTYYVDCFNQAPRIAELSNKTNQFIFNYKRYSLTEVERLMKNRNSVVVSVAMRDKLSDSGIIGACMGSDQGDFIEIEECFVSCRALGRGIDEIIVMEAIRQISLYFQKERVLVRFRVGERNKPAEQFVHQHFEGQIKLPNRIQFGQLDDLESFCTLQIEK